MTKNPRVEYLRRAGILDGSRAYPTFDRVCSIVVQILEVPVALASFVAEERQIFAGMAGEIPEPFGSQRSTPLSHSICQYVVREGRPLVVDNVRDRSWHAENLACTDLNVVAYLGTPLVTEDGLTIGSLCALDSKERRWTEKDEQVMASLAAMVMAELSLIITQLDLNAKLAEKEGEGQPAPLASVNTSTHKAAVYPEARTRSLVHELRTPLNNLVLGIDLMRELGPLNAEQVEVLDMAVKSGNVLSSLLNRVLEAELAESLQPVTVAELVEMAMEQVHALASGRRHALHTHIDGARFLEIHCRRNEMVRVLVNLLANAIKYTEPGGRISLRVDQQGSQALFVISDTGRGIPPEEVKLIFQRGFRASNAAQGDAEGQGLGLDMVSRTVHAHGGTVWAESTLGTGSTFTLSLPVVG